jgi:hypothetical protein
MTARYRGASRTAALTLATLVLASSCASEPPADIAKSLQGIDEAKFLSCSGPPALSLSQGGQDHMSFLTDLRRGAMIGISSVASPAVASCSVDAVFEQHRLVRSTFGGDASMCAAVFGPCVSH